MTTDELHGGAVWWDGPSGPYAYLWPSSVHLQQYRFNKAAGTFNVPALSQSPTVAPTGQPGGLLALSANGTQAGSGIIWASHQLTGDANQSVRPGILHAYDAGNVTNELWNSQMLSTRDGVGNFAKFVPPTVANGKVYLATFSGQLKVYGLLPTSTPPMLSVSPTSASAGVVEVGQTATNTLHVVNNGGQTLTGTVSTAVPFTIASGSSFNLVAGQTGAVQVVFQPVAAGSFTNSIIFTSNGGNSTNVITGTAILPAKLSVSPGTLNFGLLAAGSSAQASFAVTNSGQNVLSNGTASIAAGTPFTIVSGSPFNLPGGGSTNLVIQFAPSAAGSFTNSLVVASSAGGATNQVIGSAAVKPSAQFSGSPTTGSAPLTVAFLDNSTGTIDARLWDFGDGSTSNTTLTSLSHTYAGAGTNTVRLTVSGPVGTNSLSLPAYIVVTNIGPVRIVIVRSGGQLQLDWPAGTLQSSTNVTGPFADVPGALSPFTINPAVRDQFYRVRVR